MRPALQLSRLLAAAALAAPVSVLADPVGYAVGSGGSGTGGSASLYRLDLGTGAATEIGPIGYVDVEGAALSPEGSLFAVADAGAACEGVCPGGTDLLLRLDPATGAATVVGPIGLANAGPSGQLDYGLAFTCDGRLFASADTTGQLFEIDRATGSAQLRGNLGVPVSGLASWNGDLFGISVAPDKALYRIDPDSGAATRVGALLIADFYDAGLAFDASGMLWATIDYLPPPDGAPEVFRNDVARIDRLSGAATITAAVSGAGSGIFTVQMEGLDIAAGAGCGAQSEPRAVPVGGARWAWMLGAALLLLGALRARRD